MSSLDTVKAVLKSLLVSSPQNLTTHQLNKDYKAREGQDIPFSKLGYRTLTAFLISCPDTLTLNTYTGVVTAVVPENSKNADDPILLIGTSYVGSQIGKTIPAAVIPVGLKNGDIHQINIIEITSNWHFFFQFFERQEYLADMMGEISDSCITKNPNLNVHKSQLQIGTICAAFFSDKWLRAEVLAQSGDDLVKLLLIDFGTIANVSIRNIRWLLAKFCDIPRLCHLGALTFLEPIEDYKIEKMVTRTFCKMVRDKSMMGVISHINEYNTIFMTVIDTSQQQDVIINKILMESLLTANKTK